jgi:adenylate kinase
MTSVATTRYLILLGPPGAGKGTQANLLTKQLGLPHLASGDVFRLIRQEDSELGALVRSYYDKGLLVPDDVTNRMMLEVLSRDDYSSGVMLDGFPRTIDQAKVLDRSLATSGRSIWKVVYLAVPAEELIKRLSARWLCRGCSAVYNQTTNPPRKPGVCDLCGSELYQRVDDTAETARTRLDAFNKDTQPLVDYYRAQNKLCEVDGLQPVEVVATAIEGCVRGES